MTIEEVTQNLQTVASNQAQFSFDLDALRERTEKLSGASQLLEEASALHQEVLRNHEARQAKLEESFRHVAESNQQLVQMLARHEEWLDEHDTARRDADDRFDALINAQVRYEARQERLEEAFRRIAEAHQTLVQLISIHEERLDAGDEARAHTDVRLDGLIDAQIGFDERLARLADAQAQYRRQAEERGARLDEKLAQLQAAQARTDEQIKLLLDRNGSN